MKVILRRSIGVLSLMLSTFAVQSKIPVEEVKGILQELRIEHKEVVLTQFKEESGWGTSGLAVKYNNVMGMKESNSRPTTATGKTDTGFATYDSVRDCLIDYALWQSSFARGLSEEEYLKFLRRVYTKDGEYLYKMLGV